MKFEKYDPETHGSLVPDFYSEVALEPGEFDRFKPVVEEVFRDIDDLFGINSDFDVVIAGVDIESMDEDILEGFYFRGYSQGEGFQDHAERNVVYVAAPAPSEYRYWKAGLKNVTVHEEAHQEFYEHVSYLDHVVWENMVFEGHAMLRQKIVRDEKGYKWKEDPREYEGTAEEVIEVLDKKRAWNGDKYDREKASTIFINDSDWSGIGYIIARDVYQEILERNDMDIDEPLEKSRGWLRAELETSLKSLY